LDDDVVEHDQAIGRLHRLDVALDAGTAAEHGGCVAAYEGSHRLAPGLEDRQCLGRSRLAQI
jgi:hypothetical protein